MEPKVWYPLNEDYNPQPLFREPQLEQMLKYTVKDCPDHIYGQGDKGHGKTLTGKQLAKDLNTRDDYIAYTVEIKRNLKKTFEALNAFYNLGLPSYKCNEEDMSETLVEKADGKRLTLIFDEPMVLPRRWWYDFDRTIYSMYQTFLNNKLRFNMIFLSQWRYLNINEMFQPDTISRLGLKPVMFPPYDNNQIIEILQRRLDIMLEPDQYDIKSLAILAQFVRRAASIGGDMRQALQILKTAVEMADNKIDAKIMNRAVNQGKNRWWLSELETIPPHPRFLLFLSSIHAKQARLDNGTFVAKRGDVIHSYRRSAKEISFDPLGDRTLYRAFEQLATKGFIHPLDKYRFEVDHADRIKAVGKEIDWESVLIFGESSQ